MDQYGRQDDDECQEGRTQNAFGERGAAGKQGGCRDTDDDGGAHGGLVGPSRMLGLGGAEADHQRLRDQSPCHSLQQQIGRIREPNAPKAAGGSTRITRMLSRKLVPLDRI